MKKQVFSILLVLAALSCQEDEERIELLTITREPNNSGTYSWMWISDESGKILDYKKVGPDETLVTFAGRPVENLALTYLNYFFFEDPMPGGRKQFYAETTMGLKPGDIISFKNPEPRASTPIPDQLDKPEFSITGYSDASDSMAAFHFSDGFICCYGTLDYASINYQAPVFSGNFVLRQDPGELLMVTYYNGAPVYKWIENIEPGDEVVVDFSTFEPTEIIPVNKPIKYGQVRSVIRSGFDGDISKGHILSSIDNRDASLSSASNPTFNLGYLNGFDSYFISVAENYIGCCETGTNVLYQKLGDIPTSINLPTNSFQLIDATMSNFKYSFTDDYTYKEGYFQNETSANLGITWWLMAPHGTNMVAPAVPGEVLSEYPELSTKLELSFINFFKEMDGYSYKQKIEDKYSYRLRAEYETLTYNYQQIR